MKLTREEAILWHRKMWNWIADKIEKEKGYQNINYLKKEYCDIKGFHCETNNCFCCEYTKCNCDFCPIEWESNTGDFMCLDRCEENDYEGLYSLCCDEEDWKEQAKLARKIANLQERQDGKTGCVGVCRLTHRTELGASLDIEDKCPTCSICWNCDIPVKECEYIYDALEKLAKYEDTKLTPMQVLQLNDLKTSKKPDIEGDGYNEFGDIIYDTWICPNCNEHYEIDYDEYDFCPKCGQRIDRSELE
ncbi:hypothetical protein [Mediterraneibacter gnavus]|uniref:hypothetical protein n=1 Tax=Mediterraneibacter gnavus TaxID=33038 RepID=UPI0034A48510